MKTVYFKSKHKKVQHIINNKLVDLYISHEETYIPTSKDGDFAETLTCFIGWSEPIKSMSLKGKKTKMIVPKHICLLDQIELNIKKNYKLIMNIWLALSICIAIIILAIYKSYKEFKNNNKKNE